MKKLIYLIILTLILGLVLAGCSLLSNVGQVPTNEQGGITYFTKGSETAPDIFTLYAGQSIDVGTVSIWNDEENLYVTYSTTGGWEMTETHLAVATSLTDIPQAKGNPIPGKFPYKHEDLGYITSDSYIILLSEIDGGVGADDTLYIAAHAKVIRPIEDCWETVWLIGDVEEVNVGTGWLENYADEFNWAAPAGPITVGPTLAVNVPSFTNPFIVWTTPTEEFPYNSNYNSGYATNFDVQWTGSLPFGGLLTLSWSPGSSASEKKVVSEDGIIPTTLTATGANIPGQGWFMDKYPLVEHSVDVAPLSDGLHTINFQQIQGDGTFWDWIKLEKPCVQEESAWAAGEDFPGANWATYFTYTVQGWQFSETLTVDAANVDGKNSSDILESGKSYKFEVSGMWEDTSQANHFNDAEYVTFDSWTNYMDGTPNWGPNQKDLQINQSFVNWGIYASDHVYTLLFDGTGSLVNFRIFDGTANALPPVMMPGWYVDNEGFLTVKIYEWN